MLNRKWSGIKKVWIDTYYSPRDISQYRDASSLLVNPEKMKESFSAAIIPVSKYMFYQKFVNSGWFPEYIDTSGVFFRTEKPESITIWLPDDFNDKFNGAQKLFYKNVFNNFGIKLIEKR